MRLAEHNIQLHGPPIAQTVDKRACPRARRPAPGCLTAGHLAAIALGASALLSCAVDPEPEVSATSSRLVACDDQTAIIECDPGTGTGGTTTSPGPGYAILPSGRSYDSCLSHPVLVPVDHDTDEDGIFDICEDELAYAFRPRLIFNSDEVHAAREPYWALSVQRDYAEVTIFYALSYYYDGGFRTSLCGWGCTNWSHTGDSEFIVVTVKPVPSTNRWYVARVTLSRHGDTDVYSGPDIEYRSGEYLVRPKVYVSWGKHANYRSVGACNSGAAQLDDCSRAVDAGEEVEVFPGNNLGSRAMPAHDCVTSRGWFGYIKPGVDCYWYHLKFGGWSAAFYGDDRSGMATEYSSQLAWFGL